MIQVLLAQCCQVPAAQDGSPCQCALSQGTAKDAPACASMRCCALRQRRLLENPLV